MIDRLKLTAEMLANRARDMKTNVEMDPMSSYERLIVHGLYQVNQTSRPNLLVKEEIEDW
jgi:predicted RNA-binding protein Jag